MQEGRWHGGGRGQVCAIEGWRKSYGTRDGGHKTLRRREARKVGGGDHVRMLDFEAVELVTVVGLCPFLE